MGGKKRRKYRHSQLLPEMAMGQKSRGSKKRSFNLVR